MTAIVVPVPVPVSALPLPDSADLATWPVRMKELHRWMSEDAAAFISALGESAYQNALHAVAMADSAAGSANFKGAWSALTGALNMPASVSHSGRIWLLNANLANVTTATPGVSGSWIDVSNFLAGVSTAIAARSALDVYSKSEVYSKAEVLALSVKPNLIDNSNFAINQKGVSGTVTLAAGVSGHDRWCGGAAGCTYTFATSGGITTITISAGSLVQVIDGLDLETGTYTVAHSGTAQIRVYSGTYAAGPIAVSATGGTKLSIEFGTGTVKQVCMVRGTTPGVWTQKAIADEFVRCARSLYVATTRPLGLTLSSNYLYNGVVQFPTRMRAIPTMSGASFQVGGGSSGTVELINSSGSAATADAVQVRNSANNWVGQGAFVSLTATFSAELTP